MVKEAKVNDLKDLKDQKPNNDAVTIDTALLRHNKRDITDLSFTHYDSVHDLIEDTSGERHVRAMSTNAWVQIDSNKYILNARGGILTLERHTPTTSQTTTSPPEFHIIWKHSLPMTEASRSPWSKPRTVATASTLSSALAAADTFASSKFERIFIAKSSSWRKGPASEGQLNFINRLREVADEEMEPLTGDDLTKGQAGDMITKIKFGARGRFDRVQRSKRRKERQVEKVQKVRELREREVVRVGPLEA
jgi:ATP-dependent helicase IRC3